MQRLKETEEVRHIENTHSEISRLTYRKKNWRTNIEKINKN
jgi:hypothetical protein